MIGALGSFRTLFGLAVAGSRTDRYRALLIAVGAALGTVFALAGFVVLTIDGYDERYTNNILKEPGLRPGVATACWLLLIPALIFIGMCTRVCAAQRERRFAAFRLAGATPRQIRLIGAIETGIASLVGAGLGLAIFIAIRAILGARITDGSQRTLPVDEPFPWLAALLFCFGMPALAGMAGALALRFVVVGPLGVVRRYRRERPPAWPGVLLVSGPIAIALANRLTAFDVGGAWQLVLVAGVAATCIGMLCASAWLAATIGALTARVTGRAELLIAARRLETDPYGQSWAMSSVVICTFFASVATVLKADTLAGRDRWDADFYARGYELVNYGLLIAGTIAAAGLLVSLAEGVMERRRSLAALVATGTPLGTLRRAVILQGVLPLVPSVLLATTLGASAFYIITESPISSVTDDATNVAFPYGELAVIAAVGMAASVLATVLSLPFLERSVRPSELRFE